MKKTDFTGMLHDGMQSMTLEKQLELLDKISSKWIPELRAKLIRNKKKCGKCGKYSPSKDFKGFSRREIVKDQIIYCDAGYGEDDEYGDVEYVVTYSVCPLCGNKVVSNKFLIGTIKK